MAPRALHPSTSSPLAILLATVSVLAAVSEPTSLSSLEHGALLHYSTPILAAAAIVPCTRSALPPYCPLIVAAAAVASRAPHPGRCIAASDRQTHSARSPGGQAEEWPCTRCAKEPRPVPLQSFLLRGATRGRR
ncbi:hypothetical protein IWX91DRAFT_119614 [Phyllosticta citricarpa]